MVEFLILPARLVGFVMLLVLVPGRLVMPLNLWQKKLNGVTMNLLRVVPFGIYFLVSPKIQNRWCFMYHKKYRKTFKRRVKKHARRKGKTLRSYGSSRGGIRL